MTCKSCAERRAKWKKKLAEKKAKRKGLQAAGIGAALAITELGGKVLGLGEEKEDDGREPIGNAETDLSGRGRGEGSEPDSPGTGEAG